jgi:hypothetical protein
VLSGNREAMAKLTMPDLEKILAATLTGMTTVEFSAEVKKWLEWRVMQSQTTALNKSSCHPWA